MSPTPTLSRRALFYTRNLPAVVLPCLAAACAATGQEEAAESDDTGTDGGDVPQVEAGYPPLAAPCRFPIAEPTRLAVTSSDGASGAVGLADTVTRTVQTDLAAAQTDTSLAFFDDRLFVINRLGFDYIDVLDLGNALALLAQFSVSTDPDASSNPSSMVMSASGEAYVSLFGDDVLQVVDMSAPEGPTLARTISLSHFADDDGIPEMGLLIECGEVLFVAVERLDRNETWQPVDVTYLVPLRAAQDTLYDFDVSHEGADGVALLGAGAKEFRADPADDTGHRILLLSSGLERVDLALGTSEWVIDAATFAAAGFGPFQLRSFDIGSDGMAYFVLAKGDWSQHMIYRASLDRGGMDLERMAGELQTITGDLEVIGMHAWFTDTTIGASGLRIFDLSTVPATELSNPPLPTGLPPYGLLPLP
ncbi:MAG: hypothetical protein V3V08_11725 [Nannocystaceae bacterium]